LSFERLLRIPLDRVGVLIGKKGETKARIEESCAVTLSIDGQSGEVNVRSTSVEADPFRAANVVEAIARGFSPPRALKLLDPEKALEVLDIRDYAGKSENSMARIKGRIIGLHGKSRRVIEELTKCDVSVYGKTVAIIGTGRIGLAMIKKCVGFDMNMLCYDPAYENHEYIKGIQQLKDLRHKLGLFSEKTWIKYVTFADALQGADYVSVHVPLLREGESRTPTFHLFNESTLRMMRPTAYLINTSRGPVVDEKALYKAIKENWIAGAALDVFESEPLSADSPLRDPAIADRCRLFHHFASGGKITRLSPDPNKGMAGRTVQGLIDVLEGNYGGDISKMPYVVNKEAFTKKGAS